MAVIVLQVLKFIAIPLIKIITLLVAIAFYTLAERKLMGAVQRRRGPDVVGPWGLLQPVADGAKLLGKELIIPTHANSRIFLLSPLAVLTFALVGWSVIPFQAVDILALMGTETALLNPVATGTALPRWLLVAGLLFFTGLIGIVINYKNFLLTMMSTEVMYLGVISGFVLIGAHYQSPFAYIFALLILIFTACESAVGLGLLINLYRYSGTLELNRYTILRGVGPLLTAPYLDQFLLPFVQSPYAQEYLVLAVSIFLAIGLCSILAGLAYLLSLGTAQDAEKGSEYECGFAPFDSATRLPFDVKFYLVGILFLIFDVEVALILPWAVLLDNSGWTGFYSMLGFLIVLTIGFVYEWRSGAVDWAHDERLVEEEVRNREIAGIAYEAGLDLRTTHIIWSGNAVACAMPYDLEAFGKFITGDVLHIPEWIWILFGGSTIVLLWCIGVFLCGGAPVGKPPTPPVPPVAPLPPAQPPIPPTTVQPPKPPAQPGKKPYSWTHRPAPGSLDEFLITVLGWGVIFGGLWIALQIEEWYKRKKRDRKDKDNNDKDGKDKDKDKDSHSPDNGEKSQNAPNNTKNGPFFIVAIADCGYDSLDLLVGVGVVGLLILLAGRISQLPATRIRLVIRTLYEAKLLLIAAASLYAVRFFLTGTPDIVSWNGLVAHSEYISGMKLLFLLSGWLAMRCSEPYITHHSRGVVEYPLLLLCAVLGALTLISSNHLATSFFAIAAFSLSLYILILSNAVAAPVREAASKYFLLSAMSTGILAFGFFIFFYSAAQQAGFEAIQTFLSAQELTPLTQFAVVSILVGLFFKLSAFPAHLWAADVYEGCPMPVMVFFILPIKVAVLSFVMRFLLFPFSEITEGWSGLVQFAALGSLVWGCFAAYQERSTRRFLAYTSINQMGFLLGGVACTTAEGCSATTYYLVIYVLMSALFLLVLTNCLLPKAEGMVQALPFTSDLFKSRPWQRVVIILALFCMAGVPPLAGFFGKYFLLLHALERGLFFVIVLGLATSLVSTAYYLRLVRAAYLEIGPETHILSRFTETEQYGMLLGTSLLFLLPLLLQLPAAGLAYAPV